MSNNYPRDRRLRKEKSINFSGKILNPGRIPTLKEDHYLVRDIALDGDAPKEFIKAYFFEHGSLVRKRHPRTWKAFIAKTAEKWYPHESVIEFLINRIGQELGIKMNGTRLVCANEQIRFLSEYFLQSDEILIHGAEICGAYLEDLEMAKEIANDKRTAREMFTFEFIESAIRTLFPTSASELLESLVEMITFDAVVGNNDRHFYNWGVISNTKKSTIAPRFAPVYDSARGLLWNFSKENVVKMYEDHCKNGRKTLKYIKRACPRISIESDSTINHFKLISFLKKYNEDYNFIIEKVASPENQKKAIAMIRQEFSPFFTLERQILIVQILKQRFEKTRKA